MLYINWNLQHIHSNDVLRKAKQEYKMSKYFDPGPIKALAVMKRKTTFGQNVIHDIAYDPFAVQFWSSHQIKCTTRK